MIFFTIDFTTASTHATYTATINRSQRTLASLLFVLKNTEYNNIHKYYSHLESHYQRHGEHRQYEHRQDPGVAPQQGERGRGVLVDTGVRRSRRDDHARR